MSLLLSMSISVGKSDWFIAVSGPEMLVTMGASAFAVRSYTCTPCGPRATNLVAPDSCGLSTPPTEGAGERTTDSASLSCSSHIPSSTPAAKHVTPVKLIPLKAAGARRQRMITYIATTASTDALKKGTIRQTSIIWLLAPFAMNLLNSTRSNLWS